MLLIMCATGGLGNGIWMNTFDLPVRVSHQRNHELESRVMQKLLWYPYYPSQDSVTLKAFFNFLTYFIILQVL